jgi:hypothetical protein
MRISLKKTRTNRKIRPEHVIHQGLKGRWHIGQAERHYQKFEEGFVCPECRLGDVMGMHLNLVVGRTQIQLGEERRVAELVD